MDLRAMTPDQILAWASGRTSPFSGMDGSGSGSGNVFGYQAPNLNYLGDSQGSLVNSQTQPFGIKIVNSNTDADISFYLSAGADGTVKGALQAGNFAGINDEGSTKSLTATATISGQSITKLVNFARNQTAGVFIPQIKVTASDPEGFLATFLTLQDDDNPLFTQVPKNIPIQDYPVNLSQEYNTQFVTIKEEIYMSNCNLVVMTVPKNSILWLNLSLAVALENFKSLKNQVLTAAAASVTNPAVTAVVQQAQDVKRLQSKGIVLASSVPSLTTGLTAR